MKTLSYVVNDIQQPVGGFVNPKLFCVRRYNEKTPQPSHEPCYLSWQIVNRVVRYLSIYTVSNDKEQSFGEAKLGAQLAVQKGFVNPIAKTTTF